MVLPILAVTVDSWLSGLLAGFSQAGTVLTIGLVIGVAVLATRCQGRCREDEIFRLHVI